MYQEQSYLSTLNNGDARIRELPYVQAFMDEHQKKSDELCKITGYFTCSDNYSDINQYICPTNNQDWFRLPSKQIVSFFTKPLESQYVSTTDMLDTISRTGWAKCEPSMFDVLKSWILHVAVQKRGKSLRAENMYTNQMYSNLSQTLYFDTHKQLTDRLSNGGFTWITPTRFEQISFGDCSTRSQLCRDLMQLYLQKMTTVNVTSYGINNNLTTLEDFGLPNVNPMLIKHFMPAVWCQLQEAHAQQPLDLPYDNNQLNAFRTWVRTLKPLSKGAKTNFSSMQQEKNLFHVPEFANWAEDEHPTELSAQEKSTMWITCTNPLLTTDRELLKYCRFHFALGPCTKSEFHAVNNSILCQFYAARDAYNFAQNSLNWRLMRQQKRNWNLIINPNGTPGVGCILIFKQIPRPEFYNRWDDDRLYFTDILGKCWEIIETGLTIVEKNAEQLANRTHESPLCSHLNPTFDEEVNRRQTQQLYNLLALQPGAFEMFDSKVNPHIYPVVADDRGSLFQWQPQNLQDCAFRPNTCNPFYGDYTKQLKIIYEDTPELQLSYLGADRVVMVDINGTNKESCFQNATLSGKNRNKVLLKDLQDGVDRMEHFVTIALDKAQTQGVNVYADQPQQRDQDVDIQCSSFAKQRQHAGGAEIGTLVVVNKKGDAVNNPISGSVSGIPSSIGTPHMSGISQSVTPQQMTPQSRGKTATLGRSNSAKPQKRQSSVHVNPSMPSNNLMYNQNVVSKSPANNKGSFPFILNPNQNQSTGNGSQQQSAQQLQNAIHQFISNMGTQTGMQNTFLPQQMAPQSTNLPFSGGNPSQAPLQSSTSQQQTHGGSSLGGGQGAGQGAGQSAGQGTGSGSSRGPPSNQPRGGRGRRN